MIAVTGANGHLGSRLLPELAAQGPVRALVRSERAANAVRGSNPGAAVEVRVVDYADAGDLAGALSGCTAVVHLVGIIKETAGNRYRDAHEAACTALVEGAQRAGVRRVVYLSILGAAVDSANACLASRGAAERIVLDSTLESVVIRVPMVLGEGDFAAAALAARARRGFNLVLRGASLEQPIMPGTW
ncbi:MAG: NAD(P)H-binding protein [Gammaproteobacteria bacterium]|nr:NAD(P)H-binding protein [Gammaproteobacteria bacterium]